MEFTDRSLVCVECEQTFVWTAAEQLFHHDRSFKNEPKRCKACKGRRDERRRPDPRHRVQTATTCAQCGRETTVPFRPTEGRPVFCKDCFAGRKAKAE